MELAVCEIFELWFIQDRVKEIREGLDDDFSLQDWVTGVMGLGGAVKFEALGSNRWASLEKRLRVPARAYSDRAWMEEVYSDIRPLIRECEKCLARPISAAQVPPLDPLVALFRAVDHVSPSSVIGVELRSRLALLQHELLDNVEKAIQQRRSSPKGYLLHVDIGVLERLRLEFTKGLAVIKDDNQMRQVCPELI